MTQQRPTVDNRAYLNETINEALASKNYPKAVKLLGVGLSYEVDRDEWLDALEDIIRQAPDVYTLVVLGGQSDPLQLSMLAYVQAVSGHMDNGVRTMFRVHEMSPEVGYVKWLARWVHWPDVTKTLDVPLLIKALMKLLRNCTGQVLTQTQKDTFEALIPALYTLIEAHPNYGRLLWITSAILRHVGHHEQAVKLAEQALKHDNRWPMAMNLAYAKRSAQDVEGAVAAFRVASRMEPDNMGSMVELGVTLCQFERMDEGLGHLDRVLANIPAHAEALPAWCFFMYQDTKKESYYLKLEQYFQAHPNNKTALNYYRQLRHAQPYERYLPMPEDSSIASIMPLCSQMEKAKKEGDQATLNQTFSNFRLDVTYLEAPSVGIVLDMVCAQYGIEQYDYILHQETPHKPDPRLPSNRAQFILWTYEDMWPQAQIMQKVPEEIELQLSELASSSYHLSTWWDIAGTIARTLKPTDVDKLPGALIHIVKPCPEQYWPWQWVQRMQIASMLVLAQSAAQQNSPWPRQMLKDIAHGPMDWSNTAALVAMYAWSKQDPNMAQTLEETIISLFSVAKQWPWSCYGLCLISLAQSLNDFPPAILKQMLAWHTSFFDALESQA